MVTFLDLNGCDMGAQYDGQSESSRNSPADGERESARIDVGSSACVLAGAVGLDRFLCVLLLLFCSS
jgi:hypothetical protein